MILDLEKTFFPTPFVGKSSSLMGREINFFSSLSLSRLAAETPQN
jgi:hypothetical protein